MARLGAAETTAAVSLSFVGESCGLIPSAQDGRADIEVWVWLWWWISGVGRRRDHLLDRIRRYLLTMSLYKCFSILVLKKGIGLATFEDIFEGDYA